MANHPYSWKYFLNDYFIFTKGQRRAIIVLGFCILLAILFPGIYSWYYERNVTKTPPFIIKEILALNVADSTEDFTKHKNANAYMASHTSGKDEYVKPSTLFFFDPNTATADDWKQLGIRDRTIETILKYRSKGGRFKEAADLSKIYGLRPYEVELLKPYVKITPSPGPAKSNFETYTARPSPVKEKTMPVIDINKADTVIFKSLPGIGSKLGQRIINYREALGGFISIKQVAEVYGIHDTTFQKIEKFLVVKNAVIKKRNINTGNVNDLRMPYLPLNVAKAIVQYREKNGQYTSLSDLKKLPIIDEELFVKIAPYLSVE